MPPVPDAPLPEAAGPLPAVERARRVADEVLFPTAQDVDRAGQVPTRNLAALADAGLFGIAGPSSHGGLDLDAVEARRAMAAVGSGCGATFFVWVQHHGAVRTLRSSRNQSLVDLHLADLCRGRSLAGTAFAHVRRVGSPAITATRVDGGWRLDGHAPWATSWGIADWFTIAAVSDGGDLVWSLVPGVDPQGVAATPLSLPVFGATGTVALDFDGCVVPDDRVIAVEPVEVWRRADRRHASIGQPAVLGVAERARRLLVDHGDDLAVSAGEAVGEQLRECWRVDDELLAALARGDDVVADASDHRASCLGLARRATTALLGAVGGRGMDLAHPAQRLAREADFYVIQAQTADGRAATLRSVVRSRERQQPGRGTVGSD
jgi:alkylation response protein AidB-like acyl-CoA dehydrogenase